MTEKIYKVTTEGDCEGRTTRHLGYAKGNIDDIRVYYQDKKTYELRIEEVDVINITPQSANEKKQLLTEKENLERRLKNINERL